MVQRRALTPAEAAAQRNLQRAWMNRPDKSMTQEKAAAVLGFRSQGAVSQYLLGKIPLNPGAVLKFARLLQVPPESIDSRLSDFLTPGSAAAHPAAERQTDLNEPSGPPYSRPALSQDQQTLLDLFDHLTPAQREAAIREFDAKKRHNEALLAQLLQRRTAR